MPTGRASTRPAPTSRMGSSLVPPRRVTRHCPSQFVLGIDLGFVIEGAGHGHEKSDHGYPAGMDAAGWDEGRHLVRVRSSRDNYRLGIRKAANGAEAMRLFIPFHAMHRHDHFGPDGQCEGAQIGG